MSSRQKDANTLPDSDAVHFAIPARGRLAGIDYGTVRIGIAVADWQVRIASPFANYNRRTRELDAAYFQQLAANESITCFVVGLPVHLSGAESQKSLEARAFGVWLHEVTGVPVTYFDERFTSSEAEQMLGEAQLTKKQRQARLDMLAAQILLTAYLESNDQGRTPPQSLDS